jgi:hypothetical protein
LNAIPLDPQSPELTRCLWSRGGQSCDRLPTQGAEFCSGHLTASRKILAMAEKIRDHAEQMAVSGCSVAETLAWLEKGAAADEIAATWWTKVGVRTYPAELRDKLLAQPCAYCGTEVSVEVDHIVPVSRGGLSEPDNLAPACYRCNQEKSAKTPAEWREWRLSQGLDWPPPDRAKLARQVVAAGRDSLLEDPAFLAEVRALEASFPPLEGPGLGYAMDPRWRAAEAIDDSCDFATSEGFFRHAAATELKFRVEVEYELCDDCGGSGRTNQGGIDRHCGCSTGRQMSATHWAIKAAEEVSA